MHSCAQNTPALQAKVFSMRTFFAIEACTSEMHLFCSMLMASEGGGEGGRMKGGGIVRVIGPLCKHPPSNLLLNSAHGFA